jgi:adenine-specific DNA-methyltransferase
MAKLRIENVFDRKADVILYCGDCMDLLSTMPSGSVRLVVTSPPYNIGKSYEKKTNIETYLSWQKRVIDECARVLSDDGSICWQVGNYIDNGEIIPLDILVYPFFQQMGMHMRNRIIWHFEHGLHASKRFSGRYETINWFTKTDNYAFNLDPVRVPQKYPQKRYFKGPHQGELSGNPLGKNPSDVWDIPNVKANHVEKTVHPAQFPVELVERLVLSMSDPGDFVLDPFMGVGSTLIAAIMHGRRAIGAEISPEYCSIARERVDLAERGELRVRPMERAVYDPAEGKSIPPKVVYLPGKDPDSLFVREKKARRRKA